MPFPAGGGSMRCGKEAKFDTGDEHKARGNVGIDLSFGVLRSDGGAADHFNYADIRCTGVCSAC